MPKYRLKSDLPYKTTDSHILGDAWNVNIPVPGQHAINTYG
jgi:hypothetical protein